MARVIRHLGEAQTEFTKLYSGLCDRHQSWQVWSDFVYMAAAAISNAIDRGEKAEHREKQYLRISGKYNKAEQEIFPQLLAIMVNELEIRPQQDFLGEMFMALELGNHWKGQFFTPYHICHMMAKMTMEDAEAEIERKGWIGINDCACGAGATLIAARNVLAEKKLNWTTNALFVAQDIDVIVAMMCYIQLSLLGCSGYVVVGNSLTNPVIGAGTSPLLPVSSEGYDIWFTPTFYLDIWQYRRMWNSLDLLLQRPGNAPKTALSNEPMLEHQETPKTPEKAFATTENGQLTLF